MEATRESWSRLRDLVKRRDKSICYHCGETDEKGHCDHLIPLSKGGTDSILNLVWSCKSCNLSKNDKINFTPSKKKDVVILPKDKRLKPHFHLLIPRIISLFISPMPKHKIHTPFRPYFRLMIFIRKLKLYCWAHDTIWPISDEMKIIIDDVEEFIIKEKILKKTNPSLIESEKEKAALYLFKRLYGLPG